MTFLELNPATRAKLEQLGADAGSLWSEGFREERGRDPEPEECDEQAERATERLVRRGRKLLVGEGLEVDEGLVDEIRQVILAKFLEFSHEG